MNQNFRNDGMRSVRAAAGVPPRTVNIHNEGEHAESSKKDDSPSPSPSSSSPSPSSSSSSTGVWKRSASKISGRSESIVWEDNVDGECVRLEGFLNKRGEKGLVKSFLRRWFSFDSRSEPLKIDYFKKKDKKKLMGSIILSSVYEIRRTPTPHHEFELVTASRIYTLQGDSDSDVAKWIEVLGLYVGSSVESDISDDDEEDSDASNYTFEIFGLPSLTSSINFPLSNSNRLNLSDVSASIQGHTSAESAITGLSAVTIKGKNLLRLELEIRNDDGSPKILRAVHYDRRLSGSGLLFSLEENQKKTTLPWLWVLLRLCGKQVNGEIIERREGEKQMFMVHEMKCSKCRRSRPCFDPARSAVAIGGTKIHFYLSVRFTKSVRSFFHSTILNGPSKLSVSNLFVVKTPGAVGSVGVVPSSDSMLNILSVSSKAQSIRSMSAWAKENPVLSSPYPIPSSLPPLEKQSPPIPHRHESNKTPEHPAISQTQSPLGRKGSPLPKPPVVNTHIGKSVPLPPPESTFETLSKFQAFQMTLEHELKNETIGRRIDRLGTQFPSKVYSQLVDSSGRVTSKLTYGEFRKKTAMVALTLFRLNVRPGSHVILSFSTSLAFLPSLAACLSLGIIAVPAPPPFPRQNLVSLLRMINQTKPSICLTSEDLLQTVRTVASETKWIALDTLDFNMNEISQGLQLFRRFRSVESVGGIKNFDEAVDQFWKLLEDPQPSSPTLIQFSSGSTSHPKPAVHTHYSLMFSVAAAHKHLGNTKEHPISVSWMPHYHDMQLIGIFIYGMCYPITAIWMNARRFLANPSLWWSVAHNYRATHVIGPDSGYSISAQKISDEQIQGMDLSCISHCITGADVVRTHTLSLFAEKFAPAHFSPKTWATAYGMAECPYVTSIVSSPGVMYLDGGGMQTGEVMIASRLSPLKVPVISHGVPMGALVVIADPESCKLLHGKIGEIWLAGPGVAEGYYNPQALDTDMFCASLVGDDEVSSEMSSFSFFRTGDLGFLYKGELFIVGRLRELIIIDGRNFYPSDIEEALENAIEPLRSGHVVALCVADSENPDELAVIAEVKEGVSILGAEIAQRIRSAILNYLQLPTHHVVLCSANSIPRTTSGKLKRTHLKKHFEEKKIKGVLYWSSLSEEQESTQSNIPPSEVTLSPKLSELTKFRQEEKPAAIRVEKKKELNAHTLQPLLLASQSRSLLLVLLCFQGDRRALESGKVLMEIFRSVFQAELMWVQCEIQTKDRNSLEVESDDPVLVSFLSSDGQVMRSSSSLKILQRHIISIAPSTIVMAISGFPSLSVSLNGEEAEKVLGKTVLLMDVMRRLLSFCVATDFLALLGISTATPPPTPLVKLRATDPSLSCPQLVPLPTPAESQTDSGLSTSEVVLAVGNSLLKSNRGTRPYLVADLRDELKETPYFVAAKLAGLITKTLPTPFLLSGPGAVWWSPENSVLDVPPLTMSTGLLDNFAKSKKAVILSLCLVDDRVSSLSGLNIKIRGNPDESVGVLKKEALSKISRTAPNEARLLENVKDYTLMLVQPGLEMAALRDGDLLGSYSAVFQNLNQPMDGIDVKLVYKGNARVLAPQDTVPLQKCLDFIRDDQRQISVGISSFDRVKRKGLPNLKNETKMKVCVIGNDIGGIVAAQQLEAFGHEVTVFLNSEHLSVSQCQQTQMGGKSWDLGSFLMPKDYCNEVREEASPVSYEILGSKSSNKLALNPETAMNDTVHVSNISLIEAKKPGLDGISSLLPHNGESASEWLVGSGTEIFLEPFLDSAVARGIGQRETFSPIYLFKDMSQNEQVILKYGTTAGYWEKILGTLSDVRTDANVIKLIRNDLGVSVGLDTGYQHHFNKAIIATSQWGELPSLIGGLSSEEENILHSVEYFEKMVGLCSVSTVSPGCDIFKPNTVVFIKQNLVSCRIGHPICVARPSSSLTFHVTAYSQGITKEQFEENIRSFFAGAKMGNVTIHEMRHFPNASPHFSCQTLLSQNPLKKIDGFQGVHAVYYTGAVVAGENPEFQIKHAKDLVNRYFYSPGMSLETAKKRKAFVRGAGCPLKCLIYEGLYGVGFQFVKTLCLFGVEEIVILSRFTLSQLTIQRFNLLKSLSKTTKIYHQFVPSDSCDDLAKVLDQIDLVFDAIYFFDDDNATFSFNRGSARICHNLLQPKFLCIQALHQWSINKAPKGNFTIVSVFPKQFSSLSSSASHTFYQTFVSRRLEEGYKGQWVRFTSSYLSEVETLLSVTCGKVLPCLIISDKPEKRLESSVISPPASPLLKPSTSLLDDGKLGRENKALLKRGAAAIGHDKVAFMLNSFKSILSNSSEVDVDEMSNDDLLDMRLDSLGIDSQELVQLKEKVTSEVNVFIPATKFMTLTTIHQFIAEVFNAAGAGEVKTKSFSSQKTASSEAFQVGASQTRYFSGGFLGRQNEALMNRANATMGPEKVKVILKNFHDIFAKSSDQLDVNSLTLEELLSLRLDTLGISSLELVQLKDSICSELCIYIPASKFMVLTTVYQFVEVIVNASGTLTERDKSPSSKRKAMRKTVDYSSSNIFSDYSLLTPQNEALMRKLEDLSGPEKAMFMLNCFRDIMKKSQEFDFQNLTLDEILDTRLDCLGITSQELVGVKESITSEMDIYIPASKFMTLTTVHQFLDVVGNAIGEESPNLAPQKKQGSSIKQSHPFKGQKLTPAHEALISNARKELGRERLNAILDSLKETVRKGGELDVDSLTLDMLLETRLDSLGISSQELVALKEEITSMMDVYIPASKFLSLSTVSEFIETIVDSASTTTSPNTPSRSKRRKRNSTKRKKPNHIALSTLTQELPILFYNTIPLCSGTVLGLHNHPTYSKKKLCDLGLTAQELMDLKEILSVELNAVLPGGRAMIHFLSLEAFLIMISKQITDEKRRSSSLKEKRMISSPKKRREIARASRSPPREGASSPVLSFDREKTNSQDSLTPPPIRNVVPKSTSTTPPPYSSSSFQSSPATEILDSDRDYHFSSPKFQNTKVPRSTSPSPPKLSSSPPSSTSCLSPTTTARRHPSPKAISHSDLSLRRRASPGPSRGEKPVHLSEHISKMKGMQQVAVDGRKQSIRQQVLRK